MHSNLTIICENTIETLALCKVFFLTLTNRLRIIFSFFIHILIILRAKLFLYLQKLIILNCGQEQKIMYPFQL